MGQINQVAALNSHMYDDVCIRRGIDAPSKDY